MTELKLEVGKKYNARNGDVYYIIETKFNKNLGCVVFSAEYYSIGTISWFENGSVFSNEISEYDLVSEVKEQNMNAIIDNQLEYERGKPIIITASEREAFKDRNDKVRIPLAANYGHFIKIDKFNDFLYAQAVCNSPYKFSLNINTGAMDLIGRW